MPTLASGTEITAEVDHSPSEYSKELPVGVWAGTLLPPLGPPPDRANSDVMMLSKLADGIFSTARSPENLVVKSYALSISDSVHSSSPPSPTQSASNFPVGNSTPEGPLSILGSDEGREVELEFGGSERRATTSADAQALLSTDMSDKPIHPLLRLEHERSQELQGLNASETAVAEAAVLTASKRWTWARRSLSVRDQDSSVDAQATPRKSWSFRKPSMSAATSETSTEVESSAAPLKTTQARPWGWGRHPGTKSNTPAAVDQTANRSDTTPDHQGTLVGDRWEIAHVAGPPSDSGDSGFASTSGLPPDMPPARPGLMRFKRTGWAIAFARKGRNLHD